MSLELTVQTEKNHQPYVLSLAPQNELPRLKQRGINRNIFYRPKRRGIKTLSAAGGLVRLVASKF